MSGAFSTRKISSNILFGTTLGLTLAWTALLPHWASAQSIIPTPNGTGTEAILHNGQWDIQGGALSADQLNLFHQFQQFGLTEGQIANFLANPNLRNIISTVEGGNPSIINGLLQVTGGNPNLFLMNPSGIIFGPNAQLNVPASFSALTADGIQFGDRWLNAVGPNDYSTLLGDPTAFRFSSDFAGAIVNAGNLQVNPGAALSLMGGTVINTGQLTASQGQILITAVPGESLVRMAIPGYILNLEVEVPLTEGNTPQTWQLPITTLPTLLTQGLTPELLGLAVTSGGQVQLANGTPVPNTPGTAMVSGGVDVSGNQGGTVAILGDRIGLVGAQINASGTQGDGGQIRVGGEFQGDGPLPNAQRTYVDADTTINADAGPTGDGGRIIIWADEATGFYGDITARGGQYSGDGGFAEISGREELRFDGTVDLSSFNGRPGALLFDPIDIVISNDPNIATMSQTAVEAMSGNFDIIFKASGDIVISSLIQRVDQNGVLREILAFQGGSRNITFKANGDINMSTDALLTAPSTAVPGSFNSTRTLSFIGTNITLGDISTRSGIPINPDGSTGAPGGNVVISGTGNVSTGYIATFGDSNIQNGTIITSNPYSGGSITITGNSIDITRGELATGTSEGSGGNISLTAVGNITVSRLGTSPVAGGVNTRSGDITIISEAGNIDASNNSFAIVSAGTPISALLGSGGIAEFGGNITLEAQNGRITIPSVTSGARNNGGSINITANEIEIRQDPLQPDQLVSVAISSAPRQGSGSGNIQLNGNLILGNDVSITTSTANTSGTGNITINGSVNNQVSSTHNLTLNSGQGTVQVNGSIGNLNPIGALAIDSSQTTLLGGVRTANRPIEFNSPVTLNSSVPLTFTSGTSTIAFNGLNSGNIPLTLIANDFSFSGTLQGNNTLIIQPSTLSRGITLGNTVNGTLNLSPIEVAALQGFSDVTIGGGSGNITVNAPITFNTPTQLNTTGNINVSSNVTTVGHDLSFGSNVNLGQNVTLSTGPGAGNLNFLGTITGSPYQLTLDAGTGNILLPRQVNVGQFNVASAQTLFLGQGITTANTPLTFNVPIVLTQNSTLRTGTPGANITFNNTLNSEVGERNNLNLAAGSGDIAINGAVGTGPNQQLGTVTIESVNDFTTRAPIQAGSIQTSTPATGNIALNQPLTTTNGGVNLTATGAVTTETVTTNGGGIAISGNTVTAETLSTTDGNINIVGTGDVAITEAIANDGTLAITSGGAIQSSTLSTTGGDMTIGASRNIAVTNATATGGSVNISSENGDVQAGTVSATGGSVDIDAAGNVVVTAARADGGDVAISSNTGRVQANTLTATEGGIEVTASGSIVVPTVTGDSGVSLTSTGNNVQTRNATTNGGNVTLNAQTNLAVDNVTTNGGDITLRSNTDTITVNTLSSASGTAAGGAITISNPNAITATGSINASGATTGGNITLSGGGNTFTGTVTTGNLTATGVASGGNITVLARDSITAGEINTSATVGRGGNVFLDPLGDVEVSFINAQGGTNGRGGDVTIESIARFFRATGAFTDQNGILASISTAGGGGEGTITITHNGGAADILMPFIISRLSDNGTVGALTTGANNIIFPGSFLGPYTQGNIRIITSPQATLAADAALPDMLPEEIRPAETDNQPFWLDEYFTRRTEDYLGINGDTRVKSLEEIQDELQRIEDVTGVKPALIYVVFEPEEVERVLEAGLIDPDGLVNQGSLMRFRENSTDSLQLILVTSEGQPILRRPNDQRATRQVVPDLVNTFRRNLLFDFRTGEYKPATYLQEAQILYDWLVKPLENDLEELGVNNLVFIMDSGLRSTPLATLSAMHDGDAYIIENYSVGLMPSFSLTDTQYTNIRDSEVLAMGLSNFEQYPEFSNLPGVLDEIRIISEEIWPSSQSSFGDLLNERFTRENFLSERRLNPTGIVHMATHAKFEPGSPNESFIQFSSSRIRFDDLRSLGLNNPSVNLLVLSACTTALTPEDESAELGFAGIAVQAGVSSSLASLWRVNDIGTLGLMVEFYSQLQESVIKAEALRQAQLSMLRNRVFIENNTIHWTGGQSLLSTPMPNAVLSHPAYWAAFTIVGNPW